MKKLSGSWSVGSAFALAGMLLTGCGEATPQEEAALQEGALTSSSSAITIEEAWVELYDDTGFADRRLTIRYPTEHTNYGNVFSDNGQKGFNDKASSVRYHIPAGYRMVLYDDSGYQDSQYYLIGTGNIEEISSLGSFSDKTSSSRWFAY
ncbi:hypothetical protein ACLESO_01845 [Pyxidicoccus sp. 3LG]